MSDKKEILGKVLDVAGKIIEGTSGISGSSPISGAGPKVSILNDGSWGSGGNSGVGGLPNLPGTGGFNPNASLPSLGGLPLSGGSPKAPLTSQGWGSGATSPSLPGMDGSILPSLSANSPLTSQGWDSNSPIASVLAAAAGGSAATRLAANATWFTLDILGGPKVEVYSFTGNEQISTTFEFLVEVISEDDALQLTEMLGHAALLKIADTSGKKRMVHGMIREARQLRSGNKYTHYQVAIVPRFYFLGLNREHRIFQEKNVKDIIEKILKEQGFTADDYDFKTQKSYPPRGYCVQHAESDKHFISRLLEEEGIYYYFEHKADTHCLCFSDAAGGAPIEGENLLRFFQGSGQLSDSAVIARLNLNEKVNSDAAAYHEWDFTKPKLDLSVDKKESGDEAAPVCSGIDYEFYQYPHLYQEKGEGERYVDIQLLRQLTWRKWINGEADVSRLNPGFVFTLKEHRRDDLNRSWWVTKVVHKGEQPQVLRHEAPSERGFSYNASFEAIPDDIRFVPELEHKKKLVTGQQTAIVTGPPGEEIYPDKHGRVKVQFFWDREGKWDHKTTCWIRVSQGWAGGEFGTMAIPRIGQEVIVSFLEGNPDRPIITGRVYHGINTPPYELPAHKTRTVFKSLSSPGGGGFNEFRIEDKKGEEEIYAHAEKDVNVYVKNDWKEQILHDKHQTVDNFTYVKTKGETHEILEKHRKTELQQNDYLTVQGESHAKIDEKWLVKVGDEVHIKTGMKMVLEAGTELTIKAGGSFIKLDPSGVWINGSQVMINSGGSPGNGSGAAPESPEKALVPGESKVPKPEKIKYATSEKIRVPVSPEMNECMCEAADDDAMLVSS